MTVVPSALKSSTDVLSVWHAMHSLEQLRMGRAWLQGSLGWFPASPPDLNGLDWQKVVPPLALVTEDDDVTGKVTTIAPRPALLASRHHEIGKPPAPDRRRGLMVMFGLLPRPPMKWKGQSVPFARGSVQTLKPLWDPRGRLLVPEMPAGAAWAAIHAVMAGASSKVAAAYADKVYAGEAKAWRREAKDLADYADRAEKVIRPLSADWYDQKAVQAAQDALGGPSGPQPSVRPVRLRPGA